jgi:hypothetical protein
MPSELKHYGILGMRWGVRRYQDEDGSLTSAGKKRYQSDGGLSKKDARWVKKNSDKITQKATKKTAKELSQYGKDLMRDPNAINKSGKLSASTVNAYNRRMASLMNEQVADITSPSGKCVRFVAKRGEVGVMMALADQGYNMNQIKNGVYSSGKVAYRNTVLEKA